MIIMLNGSFGVGKTTVAKALREALPGSRIYDPEWFGVVLMRTPYLKQRTGAVNDFQNASLWRRSVVLGCRLVRSLARGPLIVPMTFSRSDYLAEVLTALRGLDHDLKLYCLKATLPTIKHRLRNRGDRLEGRGSEWLAGRIVECVEAHRDPQFGEPVETENRSVDEVTREIVRRLGINLEHLQGR
jgi:chloramphenicol 3-O-phosphotransferase